MDCLKYISDLELEIEILEDLKTVSDSNIFEIEEKISKKKAIVNKCRENLIKLSDNNICYRIYCYILNGLSISKAIEKVAEENYINDVKPSSTEAIWKYYYPNLKKILNVQ